MTDSEKLTIKGIYKDFVMGAELNRLMLEAEEAKDEPDEERIKALADDRAEKIYKGKGVKKVAARLCYTKEELKEFSKEAKAEAQAFFEKKKS